MVKAVNAAVLLALRCARVSRSNGFSRLIVEQFRFFRYGANFDRVAESKTNGTIGCEMAVVFVKMRRIAPIALTSRVDSAKDES
ncbi:hypothetical protein M8494_28420 [Serratia ureilytica]